MAPVQTAAGNVLTSVKTAHADAAAAATQAENLHTAIATAPATQPASTFTGQSLAVSEATQKTVADLTGTQKAAAALGPAISQSIHLAVRAEMANHAAGETQVKNGLFYKVGRIAVLTVVFLVLFGGLVWFSESGIATSLGVKFPILSVLLKPFEYAGTFLGKLWGYIESGLAWVWKEFSGIFASKSSMQAAPTVSSAASGSTVAAPAATKAG